MTDESKPIAADQTSGEKKVGATGKLQIKIGSQRDPQAGAKPTTAVPRSPNPQNPNSATTPPAATPTEVSSESVTPSAAGGDAEESIVADPVASASAEVATETGPPTEDPGTSPSPIATPAAPPTQAAAPASLDDAVPDAEELFPRSLANQLSAGLDDEIEAAMGDLSLDDLMGADGLSAATDAPAVELDKRYSGRVIKCDRESIFVTFGGHHEGAIARRLVEEAPEPGTELEVIPTRYVADENLYELVLPGTAVSVQDWSDIAEGVVVEAKISGHNKGGLECEVNHIRGFIPISQVSLFRVEDLEPYVGQPLQCVVTEANPQRGNLVLSHRALLEREREAAREKLLAELEVGQVREGVVRRLQDFGAFVDLGGVDGLIHVSQLSWDRVQHPSEVLEEGQRVKVRVDKMDPDSGRIGLSYRDLIENPWEQAESNYGVGTILDGTISKIMEFGAFVRLGPGVEGLIHISEIAHHRITKVSAFLKEGQTVTVKVLSFDRDSQRIGLSIKAAQAASPSETAPAQEEEDSADEAPQLPKPDGPLKGGLNRSSGGDQFGLKW